MKKIFKFFFRFLFGLLILAILAAAFWVGSNLWPVAGEGELFSRSELALKEIPSNSLFLQKQRIQEILPPTDAQNGVFEQVASLLPEGKTDVGEAWRFWQEVANFYAPLTVYFRDHPQSRQGMQDLFREASFTDVTPIELNNEGYVGSISLLDLHRLAWGYVIQQFLAENDSEAFGFLAKMTQQDRIWAVSARSTLSHVVSLNCLKKDLQLFLLMRYRRQLIDLSSWQEILKSIDVGQFSSQRMLAFEYFSLLEALKTFDISQQPNAWFWQIAYHPNETRQIVNELYRSAEKIFQNSQITIIEAKESLQKEFDQKVHGTWWWWRNPGGKILLRMLWVNPEAFMEYYLEGREQISQLLSTLNNFQEPESRPEFLPLPSPEAMATPVASPLPDMKDVSLNEKLQSPDEVMVIQLKPTQLSSFPEEEIAQASPFPLNDHLQGLQIKEAGKKSLLNLLGLQTGDVIFLFNGKEPKENLLEEVDAQIRAGDMKMEWLLLREGRWIKVVDEATEPVKPPPSERPEVVPSTIDSDAL